MSIDESLMNETLEGMNIEYSWDQIMICYNGLRERGLNAIELMDVDAIHQFSQLFKFQGATIEECQGELTNYVERYVQFQASTIEGVFRKMKDTLIRYNNDTGSRTLFINCIPEFTSLTRRGRQRKNAQGIG